MLTCKNCTYINNKFKAFDDAIADIESIEES